MDEHGEVHEALLMALVTGERAADDPEIEELLTNCATCRARSEDLGELAARIGDAGRESREILGEAAEWADASGEDRVEAVVRGWREPRGRTAWWPPVFALVAAALLVWLGAGLFAPEDGGEGGGEVPDGPLSEGGLELDGPRGVVEQYGTFSWTFPGGLPPRGYYEVVILDDTGDGRGTIVDQEPRLKTTEWTPSSPASGWPRAIVWTVEVFDAMDQSIDIEDAEARLSR